MERGDTQMYSTYVYAGAATLDCLHPSQLEFPTEPISAITSLCLKRSDIARIMVCTTGIEGELT